MKLVAWKCYCRCYWTNWNFYEYCVYKNYVCAWVGSVCVRVFMSRCGILAFLLYCIPGCEARSQSLRFSQESVVTISIFASIFINDFFSSQLSDRIDACLTSYDVGRLYKTDWYQRRWTIECADDFPSSRQLSAHKTILCHNTHVICTMYIGIPLCMSVCASSSRMMCCIWWLFNRMCTSHVHVCVNSHIPV